MPVDRHVPSLSHLRAFARAKATGRRTHVAEDKAQVSAPADSRVFAFVYQRFLTSAIDFVNAGRRGSALARAHETAPARMADSYRAAAPGMTKILNDLDVATARRPQRNVVVIDPETGDSLVSLRLHLLLETARGSAIAAHLHFPEQTLTPTEQLITETAVGLAAQQVDLALEAAFAVVRKGSVLIIADNAFAPNRIDMLREASEDYQYEWESIG